MRFVPNVAFGTERYPEKVARRLRVVNVICWVVALFILQFGVRRFLDPDMFHHGFIAVGVAIAFACIPLLHRFGPTAAILALMTLAYADAFRVNWESGSGGGYWLAYFGGTALGVLVLGAERYVLCLLLALVSGGSAVAIHLLVPFNTGEQPPDKLFATLLTNIVYHEVLLFAVVFYGARQIVRAETLAEAERDRSDLLLTNILPASIAARLKNEPDKKIADRFDDASVLFVDMAGFTRRAASMTPEELVRFLDGVFSEFDRLVEIHGVEKIKTTGDAYMVVSGVPLPRADHAAALAALGLDMLDAAKRVDDAMPIRIGIASGSLVAGVVGSKKFFYDVWGDAVNVASRMESMGVEGRIQVAPKTAAMIAADFLLEDRATIDVKGKGPMQTSFVVGRRSA